MVLIALIIVSFVGIIPIVNGVVKGVRKKRLKVGLGLGVVGFFACPVGSFILMLVVASIADAFGEMSYYLLPSLCVNVNFTSKG